MGGQALRIRDVLWSGVVAVVEDWKPPVFGALVADPMRSHIMFNETGGPVCALAGRRRWNQAESPVVVVVAQP